MTLLTPSSPAQELLADLQEFISRHRETVGHHVRFHTTNDPSGVLADSPFVLTVETGEMYYAINNHCMLMWTEEDRAQRRSFLGEFYATVKRHGYFIERGTDWAFGFYLRSEA